MFMGGYLLCASCLAIHDQKVIEEWIFDIGLKITLPEVRQCLSKMFSATQYTFADFPKLYSRFDRGPVDNDGWFAVPQKQYIQEAFVKYHRGEIQ